jgi:quercetin dioxygenase-like cupin family protein
MAPNASSPMHRTVSLDYGFVLEGEVELVLDSGETRVMKRGDMCVQRATNHAWKNVTPNDGWCRMVYVLVGAEKLEIAGKKLEEDLGDMESVRASD